MIKISTKKFDPANPPEGVWAPYAEGAEIQIRKLNREILKALRAPFITMEYSPAARQNIEKPDEEKIEDALTGYLIQSFKGFGDDDGNLIPDTLDGRKALMNDLAVRDFVWGFAHTAEIIKVKKQADEIKN
jgi:hypothetical protein